MSANHRGNGHHQSSQSKNHKVRVAIVGAGNCASSLVQGVHYYRNASPKESVPGLMHVNLGGYHISDIEFVAAFDIDKNKVGLDLSEAIFAKPNNTVKFSDVPKLGVKVQRGMTHDGIGKYLSEIVQKAPGETSDVVGILKKSKADVLVSYLPVGSEEATKWYVEQALAAGVGFVNCIPVFIAREPYWQKRFLERGLPIIGDDIKSQVGATIVHRVLTRLMRDRGVKLERTYQLNFGVRALAQRPQVGLHPPRGPLVRRRAVERRAQARGRRLAQLCGHRHRRGPLRQTGAGPRHRRGARESELVLHEVAARPVQRQRRQAAGGGVHRG